MVGTDELSTFPPEDWLAELAMDLNPDQSQNLFSVPLALVTQSVTETLASPGRSMFQMYYLQSPRPNESESAL